MLVDLKLRKVGNSVGVVFPKEVLAYFHSKEGDTLTLSDGPDGSAKLTPSNPEMARQMAAVHDVMERYRHTLRELAK